MARPFSIQCPGALYSYFNSYGFNNGGDQLTFNQNLIANRGLAAWKDCSAMYYNLASVHYKVIADTTGIAGDANITKEGFLNYNGFTTLAFESEFSSSEYTVLGGAPTVTEPAIRYAWNANGVNQTIYNNTGFGGGQYIIRARGYNNFLGSEDHGGAKRYPYLGGLNMNDPLTHATASNTLFGVGFRPQSAGTFKNFAAINIVGSVDEIVQDGGSGGREAQAFPNIINGVSCYYVLSGGFTNQEDVRFIKQVAGQAATVKIVDTYEAVNSDGQLGTQVESIEVRILGIQYHTY